MQGRWGQGGDWGETRGRKLRGAQWLAMAREVRRAEWPSRQLRPALHTEGYVRICEDSGAITG